VTTNAHHYAVVIGINRYPALSDLTGPRADAEEFYDWLVDDSGGRVPPANIHRVILDQTQESAFGSPDDAKPTSHDIELKLKKIHATFARAMDEDPSPWDESRLYIYASGHGIVPSDGSGAGSLLCPSTDPPNNYWDTIGLSEVHDWYRAAGMFRDVVLLADCCRDRRPVAPAWKPRFGETEHYGPSQLLMAFATSYAELAYEDLDRARGYFTSALVEGLRGGAANPASGEIRADALAAYVFNAVEAMTAGTPFEQVPEIRGDLGRPMVLRPAGLGPLPRKRRTVVLRFPDGYCDAVQLQCAGEAIDRWDPARGPWRLRLDENFDYAVRPAGEGPRFRNGGAFGVIAKDVEVTLQVATRESRGPSCSSPTARGGPSPRASARSTRPSSRASTAWSTVPGPTSSASSSRSRPARRTSTCASAWR